MGYKLYFLGSDGELGFAEWLTANSDEEAITEARKLRPDMDKGEIWRGKRLVASLSHEDQQRA